MTLEAMHFRMGKTKEATEEPTELAARKPAAPRSTGEALSTAKTLCVWVVNGSPILKTEASGKLARWGKMILVSSPAEADLVLYIAQTGSLNTFTGEGNQAIALLKDQMSGVEMWSTTKGGGWSLSGFKVSSVAHSIADSFISFYEKMVKNAVKEKKR